MSDRASSGSTVYVGNLDEKVTERVLYDILIQAGRVVDLHMPKDKETEKLKGFAFAEYETEEIADYAVRLFSGVVTLYNRTLRFAISGQDKAYPNVSLSITPTSNASRLGSHYGGNSDGNGRLASGAASDRFSQSRSRRYDTSNPISFPYY